MAYKEGTTQPADAGPVERPNRSLPEQLEEQCALYRYFMATDDIQSWEKEREERERCKQKIVALKAAIAAEA